MIQLLAVDMDGTCLNSKKRITPRTLAALRAAAEAGIIVVPTTGRALTCLPHQLLEEKDMYRYVISSNGANVMDCIENRTIFRAEVKKEEACNLISELESQRLGFTAHIDQEYLVQGRLLSLMGRMIYGADARASCHVQNIAKAIAQRGQDVEELQFFFFSHKARRFVSDTLRRHPQLSATYGDLYVEIFSKNASKGTALRELAAHLNISQENIACIGDGENDQSMFAAAGLRFAMGNAVACLKDSADITLPSNNQDGITEAIYRYLL